MSKRNLWSEVNGDKSELTSQMVSLGYQTSTNHVAVIVNPVLLNCPGRVEEYISQTRTHEDDGGSEDNVVPKGSVVVGGGS